jgi:hypothetical protein
MTAIKSLSSMRAEPHQPSAIMTDRLAAQPLEIRHAIAQGLPLKRLDTVDDMTAATLFLRCPSRLDRC